MKSLRHYAVTILIRYKTVTGSRYPISKLINNFLPELESLVHTLHIASVYALLSELFFASFIANVRFKKLSDLLYTASKGHYSNDIAIIIHEAVHPSIGSAMAVYSMELKHTVSLISELDKEIDDIETEISSTMNKLSLLLYFPSLALNSSWTL